jgi:hypothetical protein
LLGIIVIAGIALTILANRKLNVVYEVEAAALTATATTSPARN